MLSRKLRKCSRPSICDVPDEIVIDSIFMELPLTSLLQCRCVCKQWLRILTDPHFISMHFKRQERHKKLLFGPSYCTSLPPKYSLAKCLRGSVAREGVFFSVDTEGVATRLPGFKPPADFDLKQTLGQVNGIVCMEVRKKNITHRTFLKSWHLLFGNPSTGHYKILSERLDYGNLVVGFVYDSIADDYLLVRVDEISRNPHIFSLKSNSWRYVLDKSDDCVIMPNDRVGRKEVEPHNVGCCLDKYIYWLTERYSLIVRFDWKDEVFKELQFPCDYEEDKNRLSIKVVGDVLYAINVCHIDGTVEMWSMSKEENSELWTKIMSVSISYTRYFDIYPLRFMKGEKKMLCCIEYSNDGSCIRLDKRKHVLINVETNMVEDYVIKGITSDWLQNNTFELQHSAYVDSLLPPIYS